MSKVKLLTIITIGLLICNLALVGFLIMGKPHHPPHEGPKQMIIDKLSFDENQIVAYDKLIDAHKESISEYDNEMKQLKKDLFSLLAKDASDLERNEAVQLIVDLQKEIEISHYKHFEDIKALCKEEQIEKFNQMSKELAQMFAPPRPPKP